MRTSEDNLGGTQPEITNSEIVVFENGELRLEVPVSLEEETVWLNRE